MSKTVRALQKTISALDLSDHACIVTMHTCTTSCLNQQFRDYVITYVHMKKYDTDTVWHTNKYITRYCCHAIAHCSRSCCLWLAHLSTALTRFCKLPRDSCRVALSFMSSVCAICSLNWAISVTLSFCSGRLTRVTCKGYQSLPIVCKKNYYILFWKNKINSFLE